MVLSSRRFAASFGGSAVLTAVLVVVVIDAGMVFALMPTVGIGGLYADGQSFEGNVGKIYPVYQTGGSGAPGDPITDTPASGCDTRPMVVFALEDARVSGVSFRKDVEMPFLANRFMSLNVTQPAGAGGQPAFFNASEIKIYTTQLRATQLIIRNIDMREAGPGGVSGDPGDPKWGETSGELYVEGGNTTGTVMPDGTPGAQVPGLEAIDLEMWIHGLEGRQIGFFPGDQVAAVDIELDYVTEAELDRYYDGRLGHDLPEYPNQENPEYPGQDTDRDNYYSCDPVDA